MHNRSEFANLPSELQLSILLHLPYPTIREAASINKSIHALLNAHYSKKFAEHCDQFLHWQAERLSLLDFQVEEIKFDVCGVKLIETSSYFFVCGLVCVVVFILQKEFQLVDFQDEVDAWLGSFAFTLLCFGSMMRAFGIKEAEREENRGSSLHAKAIKDLTKNTFFHFFTTERGNLRLITDQMTSDQQFQVLAVSIEEIKKLARELAVCLQQKKMNYQINPLAKTWRRELTDTSPVLASYADNVFSLWHQLHPDLPLWQVDRPQTTAQAMKKA